MANSQVQHVISLDVGQVDGPDATDIPDGAFWQMSGFQMDRGYPRSESRPVIKNSQFATGVAVLAGARWNRETGTSLNVCFCNGILWKEGTASSWVFNTPMNVVSDGVDKGTITTTAVTPSSTAKLVGTLQVGDKWYFSADGVSKAVTITSITATHFHVSTYGGAGTAGAYKVIRYMSGTEVDLVPAGKHLWVFDGVNRPHYYGSNGASSPADIFREAGIPEPTSHPIAARTSTGGLLSTGTYQYAYAYGDARGNIGNPVYGAEIAVSNPTEKVALTGVGAAPSWITRVYWYKSIKDLPGTCYAFPKAIEDLHYTTIATSGGNAVITFEASERDLVIDAHIYQYCTFLKTGHKYIIGDNSSTTVTFVGATPKTSEAATGFVSIIGGFDYDEMVAHGYTDLTGAASLDLDIEAPTENTRPLTKLKHPHLFRGGGRMVAYRDGTQTEAWFTGRTDEAPTETGASTAGEGEFDYWPIMHHVGNADGDKVMRFASLGPRTFSLKQQSVWELFQEDSSLDNWQWFPVQGAESVGCEVSFSVAAAYGVLYWIGRDGGNLDLIRFDGNEAFGMLRRSDRSVGGPRSRVFMDAFKTTYCVGTVFKGRYIATTSGPTSTSADLLLVWDLKNRTMCQMPWGCCRFWPVYTDSTGTTRLYAGWPDTSLIVEVFGAVAGGGSAAAKTLITKQFYSPQPRNWGEISLRVVNGETLSAAPAISYYPGTLSPEATGVTWETTLTGDAWPTTKGEHDITKRIQAGERSNQIAWKIYLAAGGKDFGVKSYSIAGWPYPQKAMGTS